MFCKPIVYLLLCFTVIFLPLTFSYAQEMITITTYYPAPFGVYQNLRLNPTTTIPNCAIANDEGSMYYDANGNQVLVCVQDPAGTFGWQGVGLWTRQGNNVFPSDANWNIGIGITNPQAKLDVAGNTIIRGTANITGSAVVQGNASIQGATTISGYTTINTYIRGASYGFGGGFSWGDLGCEHGNAFTGGCSCPSGFSIVPLSYVYEISTAYYDLIFLCVR